MVAMISGVTAVRGTVMQGSVKNRMSPSSTAWMETPLSSSRMVMVSGAGSDNFVSPLRQKCVNVCPGSGWLSVS